MLTAKDVMNSDVVSIELDSTVGEAAELLIRHGISAVPVVHKGKLVGIVSDGDLLRRHEIGITDQPRSWWIRLVTENATLANEYIKTHSVHIGDVMSKNVITVTENTSINEIANLFKRHNIKRVPVLRNEHMIGIVSRTNLVEALANASKPLSDSVFIDDATVRAKILQAMNQEDWAVGSCAVSVFHGIVTINGIYHSEADRIALFVLVENVPGVREIDDRRMLLESAYSVV